MSKRERLGNYLLGGGVSFVLIIFGGYLIYDRVILALRNSQTLERIGIVERGSEPFWFWLSVGISSFFGCMIAALGLWGFWRIFRSIRTAKQYRP